jgi:ATP-dependent DNA helicase RecG
MIFHQIDVVKDDEWMDFLLHGQESEGIEFKRTGQVKSVVKSACAMANGTGGLIVLGLEDPQKAQGESRIFGIEENPEAVGEIKRGF